MTMISCPVPEQLYSTVKTNYNRFDWFTMCYTGMTKTRMKIQRLATADRVTVTWNRWWPPFPRKVGDKPNEEGRRKIVWTLHSHSNTWDSRGTSELRKSYYTMDINDILNVTKSWWWWQWTAIILLDQLPSITMWFRNYFLKTNHCTQIRL